MEINQTIERKLKAELDFFKVYSVFIIGLVTGNVSLLNNFLQNQQKSTLFLLILGLLFFTVFSGMLIWTFLNIKKLTK